MLEKINTIMSGVRRRQRLRRSTATVGVLEELDEDGAGGDEAAVEARAGPQ